MCTSLIVTCFKIIISLPIVKIYLLTEIQTKSNLEVDFFSTRDFVWDVSVSRSSFVRSLFVRFVSERQFPHIKSVEVLLIRSYKMFN